MRTSGKKNRTPRRAYIICAAISGRVFPSYPTSAKDLKLLTTLQYNPNFAIHPIPNIWTTFVPAKMVQISEKSIKAKNLLGKTFSKKPYNRKITKNHISEVHISGIECTKTTDPIAKPASGVPSSVWCQVYSDTLLRPPTTYVITA